IAYGPARRYVGAPSGGRPSRARSASIRALMSRSLGGPAPRDTRSTTSALGDGWLGWFPGGENIPHWRRRRTRHRTRAGFDPPRTPAARYADRESGELPRAYGCDRIVLLPRDPWWVFTYWEITPTTRVQALRALGAEAEGARELLRVYDVTFIAFTGDNAWQSFDVELPPGADRWYLNVGRPAASFCVELGLPTPGGRFLPLARSNVVTTPRATPSP